ncbi:MAG: suppressor of fused domain protein [Erysipelotrichaceae bacterium]|nr:suppressor of fused domain protein [Erysipelotrichaceae bacterium]
MGLFDIFNKKEEKKTEEVNASGWDAITEECERVYPGQKDPKHYGAIIKWRLGGPDPLDGISIYDGGDYWHFVTYGMTELYDKESEDKQWSGYGMEFTFRLKKYNDMNEEAEIKNICGVLQQIARITFKSGEIFNPFEFLYTGQTEGIDAGQLSNITGFITVPDPDLQPLNTDNGRVEFVEFIGATDKELMAIRTKETDVRSLYEKIGDVTDYHRDSTF